jgi:hypothetical protein
MILEHDDKAFELKLSDLHVALKLSLKNKSVGANTSATDTINEGTKAKVLSVSGQVKFEDENHLAALMKLAEKTGDDGARQIYTIEDKTANVGDIRQVQFHNDFNVKKMAKFEAWNVDFSLLQKNSVAEKKEERAKPQVEPVADSVTGEVVAAQEASASEEQGLDQASAANGFIWDALKKLDTYLEPEVDTQ